MNTGEFWLLGRVSDERLRSDLRGLLASGYRTEARIIAHIAEVEERKLHLRDGSESLFEYCISQLGLSNSEAFHRITAARIARKFPVVFALVEQRAVHLTAVCLLRDYLTQENHRELLAEATHKTKWQVQELVARWFPRPDVVSRIRKLPSRGEQPTAFPASSVAAATELFSNSSTPASPETTHTRPLSLPTTDGGLAPIRNAPTVPSLPPRGSIQPTAEARYRIQLNAGASLRDKLELLRALTSHSNPSGDLAVVIERAVDLALEQVQRERFAKTEKARGRSAHRPDKVARSTRRRTHIPHATQREVATRDGLRCTFVGTGGHRCTARAFLQIHHEQPWARGGSDEPNNLRLLCGCHNRLLAEQEFGEAHIAQRTTAGGNARRYDYPREAEPRRG